MIQGSTLNLISFKFTNVPQECSASFILLAPKNIDAMFYVATRRQLNYHKHYRKHAWYDQNTFQWMSSSPFAFSFDTKKQWRQSSSGLAAGATRKMVVSVVYLARVNGKYKEWVLTLSLPTATEQAGFITLISFVHVLSAAYNNRQHLTYTNK